MWETHELAHTGINRTIVQLQLVWYWPEMIAEVRMTLSSCEVCQVAKPGRNQSPGSLPQLYTGPAESGHGLGRTLTTRHKRQSEDLGPDKSSSVGSMQL